jgi:hypothetical protein
MIEISSPVRWGFSATVLLAGLSAYELCALSQERQKTHGLSAANNQLLASLDDVQKQLAALSNRLDEMSAQQAIARSSAAIPAMIEQSTAEDSRRSPWETSPPAISANTLVEHVQTEARVRPKSRAMAAAKPIKPTQDPRWQEMQSRLTQQQEQLENDRQELEKTRADFESKLSSTHNELSGSIAKNHEELVALERLGQRNYYEFEIDKSKEFRRVGPISVSLRKVNQKHLFSDLALMMGDQQLEKKHLNLYEPMMVRRTDMPQPVELVVNEIHGNTIKGYISEPKYKRSEVTLTATADDSQKSLQRR